MPDHSISSHERALIDRADSTPKRRSELLERFWQSRIKTKDPVARVGFALYCSSLDKLRRIIANGKSDYWGRGYYYWRAMRVQTLMNLALGLEEAGHAGDLEQTRDMVLAVGIRLAKQHIRTVTRDIRQGIGKTPGKLSARQIKKYHHQVFEELGIPRHYYGGTSLQSVPDSWELWLYGDLYCHDCDPRS